MPHDHSGGSWVFDPDTLSALRLEKAHNALRAGDAHRALVEAEELLDEQPHHLDALRVVGRAALDMGDASLAETAWQKVRGATPDDAEALAGVAAARFELTDLDGCITACQRLLELSPGRSEGWYYQGLCHTLRGDRQAAKEDFAAAAGLDPVRYPMPARVGERSWRMALTQAVGSLPVEIQGFYRRVPVTWANMPPLERLRTVAPAMSPFIPMLLDGRPVTGQDRPLPQPDRVWLFRDNLAWPPPKPGELAERIRHAMLVEAMHWLGLEPREDWLAPG